LWVSGALPGSVHDKKAEWIWGVLDELERAGLVTLADKGYQGSTHAKVPYPGEEQAGTPERGQPRARTAPLTRTTGKRAAQDVAGPAQATLLPPARAGKLAKAIT
jgi:hypothetical protein